MNDDMQATAPWIRIVDGVDDGDGPLTVIRARRRAGRVVLEPMDPSAVGSAGAAVAAAMPPGPAMAVWLRAPLASRRRARRVLPTLLDMAMPFPLDSCVCVFNDPHPVSPLSPSAGALPTPVGEGDASKGMEALALAARLTDVEQRLETLAGQGVDPHLLDHEGLALWDQSLRECPLSRPVPATLRLVVHVRGPKAVLVMGVGKVFWSAHQVMLETLVRTVRLQMDRAADGRYSAASRFWIWTGHPSDVWRETAETALPGESRTVDEPASFLARALAVRALTSGPLRVNLRQGALAHPDAVRRSRARSIRRAGGLAASAVFLLALNAAVQIQRARVNAIMARHIESRVERITGWPVKARGENALLIARRELDRRRLDLAPLERTLAPSLVDRLGQVLTAAGDSDARISALRIQHDRMTLDGDTPSPAAATALANRLEAFGCSITLTAADAPPGRYGLTLDALFPKEIP